MLSSNSLMVNYKYGTKTVRSKLKEGTVMTVIKCVVITLNSRIPVSARRSTSKGNNNIHGGLAEGYSVIKLNGKINVYGTIWSIGYIEGSGSI